MERFRLRLFGYPQIEVNGQPVLLKQKKAIGLLVYLAVTGKGHGRETLASLFWPGYTRDSALANLRRTLYVLRRSSLKPWLHTNRLEISLNIQNDFYCDIGHFQKLLALSATHDHTVAETCGACVQYLQEAIALYQDNFMMGFSLSDCPEFEMWQTLEEDSLRNQLIGVLAQTGEIETRRQRPLDAIVSWKKILSVSPFHEVAHQQLILLYMDTGQPDAALRQYYAYAEQLKPELNVHSWDDLGTLWAHIRAGQSLPTSPTPVAPTASGPLPFLPRLACPPAELPEPPGLIRSADMGILQREKLRYLFQITDCNRDGRIEWQDFQRYLDKGAVFRSLPPHSVLYQQVLGDLQLQWRSLQSHSRIEGGLVPGCECNSIFLEGWLAFWGQLMKAIAQETAEGRRDTLRVISERAQVHFQLFDRDQDGLYSVQEYAAWTVAIGVEMDAFSNFRRLDVNRNGYLTVDEITNYLREFYFSNDPDAIGNYLYGNPWQKGL